MGNLFGSLIIKSLENRTFTGFISVEIVDYQNDVVPVEVLKESMGVYLDSGGQLQLIHSNIPVGRLTDYYVTIDKETEQPALAVYGLIFNDGRSVFDRVWEQFTDPDTSVGFSIGGKPTKYHSETIKGKTVRIIDALELYEVSVICSIDGKPHEPANRRAKLLSLGHVVDQKIDIDQPISMVIKMVLDMPKNKNIDKEEDKPTGSEEEETDKEVEEETDKEVDISKKIQEEVEKTAMEMMGGNAALDALRESKKTIEALQKSNAELKLANDSISEKFVGISKELDAEREARKKVEIEKNAWREMFKKNTSNKDVISKLISQGRATVTDGGMPPKQGREAPMVTKEKDVSKNKEFVDEFFNKEDTSVYSDEDFLKRIRAAENLG